jgi:GT2 family glycosyltransferase
MPDGSGTRDTPALSVVVCSLNGAAGVERALGALARQTIAASLQVVLVDDGSTDGTATVGRRRGVDVVSHSENRGLAAARNSGVAIARGDIVAFLDDDCEPEPDWAAALVAAHAHAGAEVVGVGGQIVGSGPARYMIGYLNRHNPLRPLELDLAVREDVGYRFRRYLARNWGSAPTGRRRVFAFAGANMSFRVEALEGVGGFDASMRFGCEDLDVCMRVRSRYGDDCLLLEPAAKVVHHFEPTLGDTLRRSRAYGRGHALMLAKYPTMRPTLFPLPVAEAGLLALAVRWPTAVVAAAVLPHLIHPRGLRHAGPRDPWTVMDAYVACLQEAAYDLGVMEGLRNRAGDGRRRPRPDGGGA